MPAPKQQVRQKTRSGWRSSYKSAKLAISQYVAATPNLRDLIREDAFQIVDELIEHPSPWKKPYYFIGELGPACEEEETATNQPREMMFPLSHAGIWITDHQKTTALEMEFQELAAKWQEETWFSSSIIDMAMNQNYQRIIGKGMDVVPLILRELEREPDHWFWALSAITGENPITEEDAGDLEKMTEAWLALGKERGWI